MSVQEYKFKLMKSPVGILKLIASERGLAAILWENDDPKRVRLEPQVADSNNLILIRVEAQLKEYFSGERTVFDLPLDFKGTEFQKSVWQELLKIPFGQTSTYGQIAQALGNPKAMRAVGAANGKNPISIVTPCHRVIGSDGALTGFAGGFKAKAVLLTLEKHEIENPTGNTFRKKSTVIKQLSFFERKEERV